MNETGRSTFQDAARAERRGSMTEELEPIAPAEAVELYFGQRAPELSEKTLQNQRYRLNSFVEWCEDERELGNLNELTGRDIHRFRSWRLDEGGINKVTLSGQLQTLRVFLEFCAAIDAVESGMREKVLIPDLDPEEEARDVKLGEAEAEAILDRLEQFQYASREHVIVAIFWHTGIRLGALRALDVDDFDANERCLDIHHRPDSGTGLKNKHAAERSIAVGPFYCEVLQDYIKHRRDEVTDDHGRRPLISSQHGRLSASAIRNAIYRVTQPCFTGDCPHDRDPSDCEWTHHNQRSECPSSKSPHALRRGSITKHLRDGTPQEIVTERMNVSKDVLGQHYDQRTEREKMRLRREFIEEA